MPSRLVRAAALACLSLVIACGDDPPPGDAPGIEPYFDPSAPPTTNRTAEAFFAFPFPSDHLREGGAVDFRAFPFPFEGDSLAHQYMREASTLDGFSTSGGTYVRFTGPLDVSVLSDDPSDFVDPASPIAIVDVTQGSSEYGARRPLRWQWWGPESFGYYIAPNMLGFAPAWGFPLREHTTYAAIVFDRLDGADGTPTRAPALLRALLADDAAAPVTTPPVADALYQALRAQYAPLRAWLATESIDPATVVSASVFTTQTITTDLEAIRTQIVEELPAPAMNDAGWQQLDNDVTPYVRNFAYQFRAGETADYYLLEGRYEAPNYQEGDVPYETEGGALHFVDGEPEPVRMETIRFVVTIPMTDPEEGLGCYPIVMYSHGTGGSAYSMNNDDTAGRLAGRGVAGISIDQPLHGIRDEGLVFDVDILSFNFFNAEAFRSNFRQAAIDTFSLTRFVKESLRIPASVSPTGMQIAFCDDRVAYFGHSHGGLSGALAMPFEDEVDDWVLSGTGGAFGITLMERKDYIDFANLVKVFMAVSDGEDFGELHPAITFLQTLADVADPINYATYWNTSTRYRAPASVMLTSGRHDEATPYRTAIALAVAGRIPVTTPVVIPAPEFDWAGLPHASTPLRGNANGETAAFLQWTDDISGANIDTHFVIFNRPEAIEASHHFLETAVYDFGMSPATRVPTVARDANADAL